MGTLARLQKLGTSTSHVLETVGRMERGTVDGGRCICVYLCVSMMVVCRIEAPNETADAFFRCQWSPLVSLARTILHKCSMLLFAGENYLSLDLCLDSRPIAERN